MPFDLHTEITRIAPAMVETRRDLHRFPELAFAETRTAGIIAERLRSLGLDVRTGVGRTGVTGLLQGKPGSKTIAIRADIDALPIDERSSAPYASETQGAMHA